MDEDLLASLSADPEAASERFLQHVRRDWLNSLDTTTRAKAEKLIETLRAVGNQDAELGAYSEITEGIPQLARFLFLHGLWAELIDPWRERPSWIDATIAAAEREPNDYFADAGVALQRMIELGVERQAIGTVARTVAYEVVFGLLDRIDEGYSETVEEPGWALMEIDAEGELTGRQLAALHEDILTMDPSGREGKPE